MEKIEIGMREDLVRMIDQRRSICDVEAPVEMIKSDLEVARAVVTSEFPVAAIAAVLAIGGTATYTRVRTSFGRRAQALSFLFLKTTLQKAKRAKRFSQSATAPGRGRG